MLEAKKCSDLAERSEFEPALPSFKQPNGRRLFRLRQLVDQFRNPPSKLSFGSFGIGTDSSNSFRSASFIGFFPI
jgi:hypothetical protein